MWLVSNVLVCIFSTCDDSTHSTKITNADIKTHDFVVDILVRGVHEISANQSPLLLVRKRPWTFDGYQSRSPYSFLEQSKENVNWDKYFTFIKVQVSS